MVTTGYVLDEGTFATFKDGPSWRLIHLPTGLQVARPGSRRDAILIAAHLLLEVECRVGRFGDVPKSTKGRRFVAAAGRVVHRYYAGSLNGRTARAKR